MHLITSFWAINALKAWQSLTRLETVKYEKFLKSDSFRLAELNTPASFNTFTRARFTAGGAAATYQFPLSTERGGVTELISPKEIT